MLPISNSTFFANAKTPEEVLGQFEKIPPIINYYPFSDFSFDDGRIKWQTFNNLRRFQGSAIYAIGEPLLLEGYLTDINGIPIDGVSVKLIQANANGAYNHLLEKDDALYDAAFASNGVTITDNRGYYSFVTVFPGHYNRRAPHLHVLLESKHGVIETEIFFKNHPRNVSDPKYSKLTTQQKSLVTAEVFFLDPTSKELGKKARFDVVFNTNQTTKEI